MNEQDLILRKKIEKREKFDIILAYILIVILLGCIALVVVLKITDNKGKLDISVDEHTPKYISLSEISNSLNNSVLANRYIKDGAIFTSTLSANVIEVNYTKEEVNLNLNIPAIGNELHINFLNTNQLIAEEIYKEIANIICMYYGNNETYCRNTLDTMPETGNDGIRIEKNEDNTNVYITTTNSFTVNDKLTYTKVTTFDIEETDYKLVLPEATIYNISIITSEKNITITGSLDSTTSTSTNLLIKLYDIDGNKKAEKEYTYNQDDSLFKVEFKHDNSLSLEDIAKYSIEIK